MGQLPQEQRAVLVLRVVEELSTRSRDARHQPGTVMSRLFWRASARQALSPYSARLLSGERRGPVSEHEHERPSAYLTASRHPRRCPPPAHVAACLARGSL